MSKAVLKCPEVSASVSLNPSRFYGRSTDLLSFEQGGIGGTAIIYYKVLIPYIP